MSILSRLRALRSPDAACARALFAGQDLPPGAAPGQRALARLLEIAAGPGTAEELAGEVAAAAAFVQITSQRKPRRTARWALVAAACAAAVGGAVYAGATPSPQHTMVPVPFGVPASQPTAPPASRVPSRPPGRGPAHPTAPATDRQAGQASPVVWAHIGGR